MCDVFYKGRPMIADEKTSRRIFGIPLRNVMLEDMRIQNASWKTVAEKMAGASRWNDKGMALVRNAIAKMKKIGCDAYLKSKGKSETKRKARKLGKTRAELLEEINKTWNDLPPSFTEAKSKIIREQWNDSFSDFWQRVRYYNYVQYLLRVKHKTDEAFSEAFHLAVSDVDKLWEEAWGKWYDDHAKAKMDGRIFCPEKTNAKSQETPAAPSKPQTFRDKNTVKADAIRRIRLCIKPKESDGKGMTLNEACYEVAKDLGDELRHHGIWRLRSDEASFSLEAAKKAWKDYNRKRNRPYRARGA